MQSRFAFMLCLSVVVVVVSFFLNFGTFGRCQLLSQGENSKPYQ